MTLISVFKSWCVTMNFNSEQCDFVRFYPILQALEKNNFLFIVFLSYKHRERRMIAIDDHSRLRRFESNK